MTKKKSPVDPRSIDLVELVRATIFFFISSRKYARKVKKTVVTFYDERTIQYSNYSYTKA